MSNNKDKYYIINITIKAPDNMKFKTCSTCGFPWVYDGSSDNCRTCDLNVEESKVNNILTP